MDQGIESVLRENAVWFVKINDLAKVAGMALPDIKGPVLIAVLPVVK